LSEEAKKERKIWWLASYPKSGNTWVRTFLDGYLRGSLNINQMMMVASDLYKYYYHIVSPIPVKDMSIIDYIHLRPAALMHLIQINPQYPLVVKTHNANIFAQQIPLLPPSLTAGVVYLIRDPRDVVISWSEHMGKSYNKTIEIMEDENFAVTSPEGISHIISSWSTHVDSYASNTLGFKVGVIRYEDLLVKTEVVFKNILTYLGITINEEQLKISMEDSSFKNLQALEEKHGFKERKHQDKFFKRGTSGHWKDILTDKMVKRIESVHGEMMQKHGYELAY